MEHSIQQLADNIRTKTIDPWSSEFENLRDAFLNAGCRLVPRGGGYSNEKTAKYVGQAVHVGEPNIDMELKIVCSCLYRALEHPSMNNNLQVKIELDLIQKAVNRLSKITRQLKQREQQLVNSKSSSDDRLKDFQMRCESYAQQVVDLEYRLSAAENPEKMKQHLRQYMETEFNESQQRLEEEFNSVLSLHTDLSSLHSKRVDLIGKKHLRASKHISIVKESNLQSEPSLSLLSECFNSASEKCTKLGVEPTNFYLKLDSKRRASVFSEFGSGDNDIMRKNRRQSAKSLLKSSGSFTKNVSSALSRKRSSLSRRTNSLISGSQSSSSDEDATTTILLHNNIRTVHKTDERRTFWGSIVYPFQLSKGYFKFIIDVSSIYNKQPLTITRQAVRFGVEPIHSRVMCIQNPSIVLRDFYYDENKSWDENTGIVSFVMTSYGSETLLEAHRRLANPRSKNSRQVTCQASSVKSAPSNLENVTNIKKRDVEGVIPYFSTDNSPKQWITIDLGAVLVIPQAYSFASAQPIMAGQFPRSWRFEGSLDTISWTLLKQHHNDLSFSKRTPYGVWFLDAIDNCDNKPIGSYYRYFRVTMESQNSTGTHELQLSCLEIYGRLLYVAPDYPLPSHQHVLGQRPQFAETFPSALPPEAKRADEKKPGRKKKKK